jgi:hypothetical protein
MYRLLLIILSFTCSTLFAQTENHSFIGHWTEGILNKDSTISVRPVRRGGPYSLDIQKDNTITLYDGDNCGSGFSRKGNWSFENTNNVLTFVFTSRQGYSNEPASTGLINQTEKYEIVKLNSTSLILKSIYKDNNITYILIK